MLAIDCDLALLAPSRLQRGAEYCRPSVCVDDRQSGQAKRETKASISKAVLTIACRQRMQLCQRTTTAYDAAAAPNQWICAALQGFLLHGWHALCTHARLDTIQMHASSWNPSLRPHPRAILQVPVDQVDAYIGTHNQQKAGPTTGLKQQADL